MNSYFIAILIWLIPSIIGIILLIIRNWKRAKTTKDLFNPLCGFLEHKYPKDIYDFICTFDFWAFILIPLINIVFVSLELLYLITIFLMQFIKN